MKVTITSLELKKLYYFFPFSWAAMQVVMQIKKSPALQFKSTGFGKKHYTMSLWDSEDDLKKFAREGAHLEAMKKSSRFSREIRTYTFDGDSLPDWKKAKEMLLANGKSLRFQ